MNHIISNKRVVTITTPFCLLSFSCMLLIFSASITFVIITRDSMHSLYIVHNAQLPTCFSSLLKSTDMRYCYTHKNGTLPYTLYIQLSQCADFVTACLDVDDR